MSFIVHNDGFVCEWCGKQNIPAPKTCRNHCAFCLCSKHLDEHFPGDRKSNCGGKMELWNVEISSEYEFILIHRCQKCGKTIRNKMAEDDNQEIAFEHWKTQEQKKLFQ